MGVKLIKKYLQQNIHDLQQYRKMMIVYDIKGYANKTNIRNI